jgi:twitching motility protein PilT
VALVESLLTAIVRADGDALVLHVGERPYVVAASGQVELSTRALTLEAISGILGQLISPEAEKSLGELGAVEHRLAPLAAMPEEGFTVVAARGGDDIWVEIRRYRHALSRAGGEDSGTRVERAMSPAPATAAAPNMVETPPSVPVPPAVEASPSTPAAVVASEKVDRDQESPATGPQVPISRERQEEGPAHLVPSQAPEPAAAEIAAAQAPTPSKEPSPEQRTTLRRRRTDRIPVEADIPPVTMVPVPPSRVQTPRSPLEDAAPSAAIVLPLARGQVRGDPGTRVAASPKLAGLDRLLRVAAARGASTLYLVSGSKPSIRVDGEISLLEGEAVLSAPEVESHILDIMPERNREALRSGVGTEWICDVADVGRIRCMSFRDHRGAGGIFRMIPARAISAEQLGLSREIQGLCAEAEGLVLVTGPRSSGKSTLISAFVDLINRTRSDHVITLESQIKFVHESRTSLVSQREVRGDNEELVAAVRTALRENPDVLVIEDLRTPELLNVALAAAESGHLVIGSLSAHTTTAAIDRIIDQTAPERRPKIQLALAEALRGIVAQVLVRKTGGGRLAAREVLLNTSSVANLIAEGKTSQLPLALDGGRRYGMVPLNDALVAFVQSGVVDAREAYRHASDRPEFLNQLRREGVDTSFVERLA